MMLAEQMCGICWGFASKLEWSYSQDNFAVWWKGLRRDA